MKTIAKIKDKQIEAISGFNNEETLDIESRLNNIYNFKKLNINFDKIVETHEKILKHIDERIDFLGLIVEFLNLYKTFLFHWEKLLKNRFTSTSEEYKQFEKATNLEYDDYFSYRFINELRNFVQHCGYPKIIYDSKLEEDNTSSYSLTLYTAELIEDFDWKPSVLKVLRKTERLNLLVIMVETVNCLYRINNIALNICFDIKKLYTNINYLLELEKFRIESKENIAVLEYKNFKDGKFDGLGLNIIEFDYLKKVKDNISVKRQI